MSWELKLWTFQWVDISTFHLTDSSLVGVFLDGNTGKEESIWAANLANIKPHAECTICQLTESGDNTYERYITQLMVVACSNRQGPELIDLWFCVIDPKF